MHIMHIYIYTFMPHNCCSVDLFCCGGQIISNMCCDMHQSDTIGKIELNPSFILSSDNTKYKNDIQ